jgi:glycosyltransferase involved in cell wall biosynthesis
MRIVGSNNPCKDAAGACLAEEAPAEHLDSPYRILEQQSDFDLTFFVACYNEESNITGTLDSIQAGMRDLPLRYEIIVIDDASRDGSVATVKDYMLRHPSLLLRLVESPKNRGLAHNFAEGSFLGRGRYYKLVCGDNVEPPETLRRVLEPLGNTDLIIPFHEQCHGRSRFRKILSRSYTRLMNLISGYSLGYYNGCGVFRRVDVMRWHSRTSGFGFQAELVISLLDSGASYVQVPIIGRDRQTGTSSALKIRNWISISRTLLAVAFRRRPH